MGTCLQGRKGDGGFGAHGVGVGGWVGGWVGGQTFAIVTLIMAQGYRGKLIKDSSFTSFR